MPMPTPFLPGYDASAVPAADDLLVAATVDGRVVVLPDGNLPTVAALPDLPVYHIGTLRCRPVWQVRWRPYPMARWRAGGCR
jgi:hypothetical protein